MEPDVLYIPDNILYCSEECLFKEHPEAGLADTRDVDQEEFDRVHDENVESGNHWGALCPVCEKEYHNF